MTTPAQRILRSTLFAPHQAVVNTYGSTQYPGIPTTPATFSRAGLHITAGRSVDPGPLLAANPDAIVLFYIDPLAAQRSSTLPNSTVFQGLVIWAGWWLTAAGTTLASAVTASTTSLAVAATPAAGWPATPFYVQLLAADHSVAEVAYVTAVSGTTLTVQRGVWQSTAAAFAAGARVGNLVYAPGYPTSPYLNPTTFCPVNPASGQRASDYIASVVAATMATFPGYKGCFLDQCNHHLNPAIPGADADLNQVPDGGDGTSGHALFDGFVSVLTAIRASAPAAASWWVLTNGDSYAGFGGDGMFYEDADKVFFSTPPPFKLASKWQQYRALTTDATPRPVTIWNLENNASNVLSPAALALARFHQGLVLMGDGWFAFDYGGTYHGSNWVLDEAYGAMGTTLTADCAAGDTTLAVANARFFMVGDIVRLPYPIQAGVTGFEDELMAVTAIPDATHLQVQRQGPHASMHVAGTAVATASQLARGVGWLGQPLGPVDNSAAYARLGANLITSNADFETFASGAFTGWNWVTAAGGAGTVAPDTQNPFSGTQSVKVTITVATSGAYNAKLTRAGLALQKGGAYSLRFAARADRLQRMFARFVSSAGSVCSMPFDLSPGWFTYGFCFYPATTDTFTLQLEFDSEVGNYWVDAAELRLGDEHCYLRQFTSGLVLLNATPAAALFTLPAAAYHRLDGSQVRSVNDGSAVGHTVTVPPMDALLLRNG